MDAGKSLVAVVGAEEAPSSLGLEERAAQSGAVCSREGVSGGPGSETCRAQGSSRWARPSAKHGRTGPSFSQGRGQFRDESVAHKYADRSDRERRLPLCLPGS